MKIGQISKADSFGGGASRVAEELNELMLIRGHESVHYVSWSGKPHNAARRPLYGKRAWMYRKANSVAKALGAVDMIPFELPRLRREILKMKFDVLHFHDLSSAISPYTVGYLSRMMPVVWTIHDCSAFTGGCLYPMNCQSFQSGCGKCPQLGKWPMDTRLDFSKSLRNAKKRIYASSSIHFVAPSEWMAKMAFDSGTFPKKPTVISNGIDTTLYQAGDKASLRSKLGIPHDRKIVLLSAGDLSDDRKGVAHAIKAVRGIADLKPMLLLLGHASPSFLGSLHGIDYLSLGYISSQSALAEAYGAADLFLFCSLADNQPLSILESMSAGTPIVGYATGGIPEIIRHGQDGFLAAPGDIDGIVAGLRLALTSNALIEWRAQSITRINQEFSYTNLYSRHRELYQSVISSATKV